MQSDTVTLNSPYLAVVLGDLAEAVRKNDDFINDATEVKVYFDARCGEWIARLQLYW